jgi:hypothetical protein
MIIEQNLSCILPFTKGEGIAAPDYHTGQATLE